MTLVEASHKRRHGNSSSRSSLISLNSQADSIRDTQSERHVNLRRQLPPPPKTTGVAGTMYFSQNDVDDMRSMETRDLDQDIMPEFDGMLFPPTNEQQFRFGSTQRAPRTEPRPRFRPFTPEHLYWDNYSQSSGGISAFPESNMVHNRTQMSSNESSYSSHDVRSPLRQSYSASQRNHTPLNRHLDQHLQSPMSVNESLAYSALSGSADMYSNQLMQIREQDRHRLAALQPRHSPPPHNSPPENIHSTLFSSPTQSYNSRLTTTSQFSYSRHHIPPAPRSQIRPHIATENPWPQAQSIVSNRSAFPTHHDEAVLIAPDEEVGATLFNIDPIVNTPQSSIPARLVPQSSVFHPHQPQQQNSTSLLFFSQTSLVPTRPVTTVIESHEAPYSHVFPSRQTPSPSSGGSSHLYFSANATLPLRLPFLSSYRSRTLFWRNIPTSFSDTDLLSILHAVAGHSFTFHSPQSESDLALWNVSAEKANLETERTGIWTVDMGWRKETNAILVSFFSHSQTAHVAKTLTSHATLVHLLMTSMEIHRQVTSSSSTTYFGNTLSAPPISPKLLEMVDSTPHFEVHCVPVLLNTMTSQFCSDIVSISNVPFTQRHNLFRHPILSSIEESHNQRTTLSDDVPFTPFSVRIRSIVNSTWTRADGDQVVTVQMQFDDIRDAFDLLSSNQLRFPRFIAEIEQPSCRYLDDDPSESCIGSVVFLEKAFRAHNDLELPQIRSDLTESEAELDTLLEKGSRANQKSHPLGAAVSTVGTTQTALLTSRSSLSHSPVDEEGMKRVAEHVVRILKEDPSFASLHSSDTDTHSRTSSRTVEKHSCCVPKRRKKRRTHSQEMHAKKTKRGSYSSQPHSEAAPSALANSHSHRSQTPSPPISNTSRHRL
ncbi:hypothetical protein BLNAU_2838 [Blattamonas nauphoetae]|uniref:Uncharacterized protein n=1 Tax=Blattamonas nauphoetae TaxID=2049346 RepID=A0ABQ9YEH9_9EUKA|nr:hypothetical protein BLNAU_2838 [Blattamonas nauphoetae]